MTIDQVKILVHAVQKLSQARTIDVIVREVRTVARQLANSDGATFVLRDNDLCYYADEDAIGPLWKGQRFPMTACISGWSMLNKQSVVIPDIYADERIPILAYKPTFVKSLAMVPIRTIEPIGAIGIYWAEIYEPTPEQIHLVQSLADLTSVSIENVYAYNKLKEQNEKLYEIASLQSHQVRAPIANIKGLINLFNYSDANHPDNALVISKLKETVETFDQVILKIVQNTKEIPTENDNPQD